MFFSLRRCGGTFFCSRPPGPGCREPVAGSHGQRPPDRGPLLLVAPASGRRFCCAMTPGKKEPARPACRSATRLCSRATTTGRLQHVRCGGGRGPLGGTAFQAVRAGWKPAPQSPCADPAAPVALHTAEAWDAPGARNFVSASNLCRASRALYSPRCQLRQHYRRTRIHTQIHRPQKSDSRRKSSTEVPKFTPGTGNQQR
jgi:hypothetical protein